VVAFVDTSALYALLDARDTNHSRAWSAWGGFLAASVPLVTTNYVLLETLSLLQKRLGLAAVRRFAQAGMPLLQVHWVDEAAHASGVAALLLAARRELSLVDCVSFCAMRELGLHEAFAFDTHFAEQGFSLLPTPE